jgi:hypothetical protein
MKKTELRSSNKDIPELIKDAKKVEQYLLEVGRSFAKWRELQGLGISQSSLRRLQTVDFLIRESYGRYSLTPRAKDELAFKARQDAGVQEDAPVTAVNSYLDSFVEVSKQVPRAVVSLLSASAYHNLTLDVPFQVWIALEHGSHIPKIEYPPIKPVMRRLKRRPGSLTVGVDEVEFEGVKVLITDLERTVVDLYDYGKFPDPKTAEKALMSALERPEFDREKLLKYARQFGVQDTIRRHVELFDLIPNSQKDWDDWDGEPSPHGPGGW